MSDNEQITALGKQTETTTQEDIEKAAEKHADELRVIPGIPGALVPMFHDIAKSSYLQERRKHGGKAVAGGCTTRTIVTERKYLCFSHNN